MTSSTRVEPRGAPDCVSTIYLDTSAVGRVLLGEPEARAVLHALDAFDQRVSSRLLRLELRRLALRHSQLDAADQLLAGIALVPVDEAMLTTAETIAPASVATLEAIHLTTAVRLSSAGLLDAVMTYDARLADGAREHQLSVLTPA